MASNFREKFWFSIKSAEEVDTNYSMQYHNDSLKFFWENVREKALILQKNSPYKYYQKAMFCLIIKVTKTLDVIWNNLEGTAFNENVFFVAGINL